MIYVYICEHRSSDSSHRRAVFCEKSFWKKNRYISDGYDRYYNRIIKTFEKHELYESMEGEIVWTGFELDEVKEALKAEGVTLLIDDKTFINEYKKEFGDNPKDTIL